MLLQKPYVVRSKIYQTVNGETIAKVVVDSVESIFDTDASYKSRILLFVTDAVAYMIKAGKLLKDVYPNMLHFTLHLRVLITVFTAFVRI